MLKVRDLEKIFNEIAAENLKEDFDNVGLMVGESEQEIKKILVSLDCTMEVIDEAIEKNCNMIFSHHPLIFKKPSSITDKTLQGKKILKLIKNNIAVYSAHTNLDAINGGINDLLVEMLGFKEGVILEKNINDINSGIGRLVTIDNPIKIKELLSSLKEKLRLKGLRYSGDLNKSISKVAIINGSGVDFFSVSKEFGAEVIITGDTTYHPVSNFLEEGISIIDIGHFKSEFEPLKIFAKMLIEILGGKIEVEVSNNSKDPYDFY